MPTDVVMPQMGESIFEGTITKWLKKPGEKVQRDEPLFEISTDKVDAEIPAPSAGVLKEIKVPEGTTVQVNTVVGVIDADGAGAAAPAAAPPKAEMPRAAAPAPSQPPQPSPQADGGARQPQPTEAAARTAQPAPALSHRRPRLGRKKLSSFPPRARKKASVFALPRWSGALPANTTSTWRRCPAPASAGVSPSRTLKPLSRSTQGALPLPRPRVRRQLPRVSPLISREPRRPPCPRPCRANWWP